jgi:hypothetical protein
MATNSSLRWINHPNPYGLIHIHLQLRSADVNTMDQSASGMPIASSNARTPKKMIEYYLLERGPGTGLGTIPARGNSCATYTGCLKSIPETKSSTLLGNWNPRAPVLSYGNECDIHPVVTRSSVTKTSGKPGDKSAPQSLHSH